MKVKITNKCFTGDRGNMFPGEEHEISDRIAEKLIARGYAEEAKEKKVGRPKKKLEDRSYDADEIVTPEDE
jgi:hypothetical protein